MRWKAGLVLAIAALAWMATGCGPRETAAEEWTIEKCKTTHDLITKPECGTLPGPPGPIITIEPGGGSSAPVSIKVNGTPQQDSTNSIFPPNEWDVCELRQDFIGTKILEFEYFVAGISTGKKADFVTITNDDYRIEIRRTSSNKIHWTVKQRTGALRVCAGPDSTTSYTDGYLPSEFFIIDGEIREEKADKEAVKIKIQVEEP